MSYRASFWVELVGSSIWSFLDLLTVIVLFRVTKSLGGFPFSAVFLMASITSLSFGIADQLVGNIDHMREPIRTGRLDALLVRPLGVLGQLLATDFELRRIGRIVQALVVLGFAVAIAGPDPTWQTCVLLVLTPLSGAVFFASVLVIGGSVAFWWIDSGEFANGFTYGGRDFTTYPITVYGQAFRRLFAFGLGFAFVTYYPTLAILHLRDPLGLPSWVGWLSPLAAAAIAGIAAALWRSGVRHYRSTGS